MRRILGVAMAGVLLASVNVWADCGMCGKEKGKGMKAGMTAAEKADKTAKKLNLDEAQKAQYEALVAEKMAKKEQIMADKMKAMEALHADFKAKLGAVLTPEQMKSWEAMKDDRGPKMGKCPMCQKEGKLCEHCKMNMDCPECQKSGKMCKHCMMKKDKAEGKTKAAQEGHDTEK